VAFFWQQPALSPEIVEGPQHFMLPRVKEVAGSSKLILVVHPYVLRHVDEMSVATVCLEGLHDPFLQVEFGSYDSSRLNRHRKLDEISQYSAEEQRRLRIMSALELNASLI